MGHVGSTAAPAVKDAGRISIEGFSQEVGSGGTAVLVTAAQNVAGLLLYEVTISSGAVGVPSGNFLVQDQVVDSSGNVYGSVEIGLAASGSGQAFNGQEFDWEGALVPAGVSLSLVNGGAGGNTSLRHCSAVLSCTVLQ
jgi:hypothetical protein